MRLAFGETCSKCQPGQYCHQKPTPESPWEVECPTCEGDGELWNKEQTNLYPCTHCGGEKVLRITCCPYRHVPDKVWGAVEVFGAMENGILPGPGGLRNQPSTLIDAVNVIRMARAAALDRQKDS